MLTKEQLLDEAQKQKKALATMGLWRTWIFAITTTLLAAAIFGLRGSGPVFIFGVIAAVGTAISFILLVLVDLSIRNGHRNVERLLESLKS